MPATLTPAPSPTFPATLTAPINGENLDAAQEQVLDQALLDGNAAARLLMYGGGVLRRVRCSSNTVMVVQPLGAVVATLAGVWTVIPWTTGAATINPSVLSGGLAASTRYWVYATAVLSTGIPVFVVSTNAPDIGLKYSSATTDQMYVSTFYVNAGGTIIRYTQSDGDYTYFNYPAFGGGASANLILDTSVMVGSTTVPYGNLVPSQASAAKLKCHLTGGAGPEVATILGTGIGTALNLTAAATQTAGDYIEMSTVLASSFDYTLAAGTGTLSVLINGFTL